MANWVHGEGASIALDDSHFPVVITTWKGSADQTVADAFTQFLDAQMQRAEAEGVRLIGIYDALEAVRPRPEMRDAWTAVTDRLSGRAKEQRMLSIMVVDSAVIRTVMTAVIFFANARSRTKFMSTRERAIDFALQALDAEGGARPKGLHPDRYEPPNYSAAAV